MSKLVNVVFILSDDQGPWAVGYNNPEIRTPNLDRLAREGTVLDNFFVATPVCSPSRATFLTGRIPSQHGVHDWLKGHHVGPETHEYLRGETAYTKLLARDGYTCGLSGKWHLGRHELPQQGFTDWYAHQRGGAGYYDAPMVRDGRCINEPGYVTDHITNEAARLLDRYAEAGAPFYLSVHYTAPHSPWFDNHPQDLVDSYADCAFESCPQEPIHPWAVGHPLTENHMGKKEALQGYFASVTAMDAGIGKLLDRLEAHGLRENTLVCFFSDNGHSCGHHGFWGKGNATHPRNMYENSIKVPAVLSHTGRIAQGARRDELLSAYDVCPTLLDYLRVEDIADRGGPGKSFAPLLEGKPLDRDAPVVIYDEYGPVRMIRTRDWKYVYRHAYGPHELYHLQADPDERANLIDAPDQKERIDDMHAQMEAWFARYVTPAQDGLRIGSRQFGQTEPL